MSETIPPTPRRNPKTTREYAEGQNAHEVGEVSDDNPYESRSGFNDRRFFWFIGYFEAKWARWLT